MSGGDGEREKEEEKSLASIVGCVPPPRPAHTDTRVGHAAPRIEL